MIELIQTDSIAVLVDVVGAFGVTASAEQTKNPVQDGSLRSDHKVLRAPVLQIEVQQTEQPLDDPEYDFAPLTLDVASVNTSLVQSVDLEIPEVRTKVTSPFLLAGQALGAGIDAIAGAFGKITGASTWQTAFPDQPRPAPVQNMEVLQTSAPRDRGGELSDLLTEIYAGEDLATVTYKGRTYTDLSLVEITISYTPGAAGLTTYQLSFEEIMIAQTSRVQLPDPASLANKASQALGRKKAGEQDQASAEAAAGTEKKTQSILSRFTP